MTSLVLLERNIPIDLQINEILFRPLSTWIDGTDDYIALVDVTDQGYASAQRGGAGFDIDHTVSILKVLADFHALSLAIKHHNPKDFEELASQVKVRVNS